MLDLSSASASSSLWYVVDPSVSPSPPDWPTTSSNVPVPASLLSPNFHPLALGKLPCFQLAIQSSAESNSVWFFLNFFSSGLSSPSASLDAATRKVPRTGREVRRATRADPIVRARARMPATLVVIDTARDIVGCARMAVRSRINFLSARDVVPRIRHSGKSSYGPAPQ